MSFLYIMYLIAASFDAAMMAWLGVIRLGDGGGDTWRHLFALDEYITTAYLLNLKEGV
jgi:hypothetical protein